MGFVNISNNCIPIGSLGLPRIDPGKTIKVSNACTNPDQIYSTVAKKCVCKDGMQLDSQDKCVAQCPNNENYNNLMKTC